MRPGLPGYEPWYKPFLGWANQLTLWEWMGLAFLLLTILYLFYCMIYWRTHFGESMELRYEGGFPGVEGPLDGEFELADGELCFKDLWKPNRIHFRIPLDRISNVATQHGGLSTLAYWFIGAPAILGQHNSLEIYLRNSQEKSHALRFIADRHSKAPSVWRKRLREAVKTP